MNYSNATQKMFAVAHASDISNVRRWSTQLAESIGFDETTSGKLAIAVTEAATNILKHATSGSMFIASTGNGSVAYIEVTALDRGPGIANLALSRRDGISSTGTSGNGLGAMYRLADSFDIYSSPGKGTAIYFRMHAGSEYISNPAMEFGAICVPVAGEEECGDAWAVSMIGDVATIMVADGLGHGPDAAVASGAAVKTLQENPTSSPESSLHAMHQALRPTRGAAVAVMQLNLGNEQLFYAGIGNISACIMDQAGRKQLVSHNGIVGNNMRKVQQFTVPCAKGLLAVMCSDGIGTQWDLDKYPGLITRHPALIAGVIYRDFMRGRDDATVVAARVQ